MAEWKAWTNKDIQSLEDGWAAGRPVHLIARALRRTEAAVRIKAYHLGLRRRNYVRWSDEDVALLVALHAKGTSIPEIARHLVREPGPVRSAIRTYCHDAAPTDRRPWTAKEERLLEARWKVGERAYNIAKELNRSINAIRCRANQMGLQRQGGNT